VAAFYKNLRIQAHAAVHEHIGEYVSRVCHSGARVLDIAAGTGSLTQRLLDLGFQVHCTTWNDKLEIDAPAYRLNLDDPFGLGDVGSVAFDAIIASEIIEHVENPSALLRSCANCLKSDGLLIVTTPNIGYTLARLQTLKRGYPEIFAEAEVKNNRHISMIWPPGFKHIAGVAGLRLTETAFMGGGRHYPLHKRAGMRLLELIVGSESSGASCVFYLSPADRIMSNAATTY
jgi:SAM-dependent methyltransferase